MSMISVYEGHPVLADDERDPRGNVRTKGLLSGESSTKAWLRIVRRIDVDMSACMIGCVHTASFWLEYSRYKKVVHVGVLNGDEIQCIYELLGSPGWESGAASDREHFAEHAHKLDLAQMRALMTRFNDYVAEFVATLPAAVQKRIAKKGPIPKKSK